jgi:hypothetical protein
MSAGESRHPGFARPTILINPTPAGLGRADAVSPFDEISSRHYASFRPRHPSHKAYLPYCPVTTWSSLHIAIITLAVTVLSYSYA